MPKISAKAGAFQQEIEWAAEGGWKCWVQRSPFRECYSVVCASVTRYLRRQSEMGLLLGNSRFLKLLLPHHVPSLPLLLHAQASSSRVPLAFLPKKF